MSNGIGCKCASSSASECCCDDVNWNQAPLSDEELLSILKSVAIGASRVPQGYKMFAREIEKAHGIVGKK